MAGIKLVDTMRDFLMYWREYSGRGGEEMFEGWLKTYMANYPEALIAEVSYRGGIEKLRAMMRDEILPEIDSHIHEIIEGWMTFLENFEEIRGRAEALLRPHTTTMTILYVGSGWKRSPVASVLSLPILLFDLGALAELGWITGDKIRRELAFAFGKLYHALARGVLELENLEKNPFFRLYSEGVAQLVGSMLLEKGSEKAEEMEWVETCRAIEGDLARAYLELAETGNIEEFYDPRLRIRGAELSGRYLGYRIVKELVDRGTEIDEMLRTSGSEAIELSKELLRSLVSEDQ